MNVKYLIIGAGPAGLGAGWELNRLQQNDFLIIEKESYIGGLSASFKDENGFFWDLGGHVLFNNDSLLAKLSKNLLFKKIKSFKRKAAIYLDGKFIPYPFQDNYPVDQLANKFKYPKNFKQWLYITFGKNQAEIFFIPQNEKSWVFPLNKMNFDWIAKRIKTLKDKTKNWGANARFLYPQSGGIGFLWEKISQEFKEKIILNSEVKTIDELKKEATLINNKKINYQYLITSMPLDLLVNKLANKQISKFGLKLKHNHGLIIGLGIKGKLKTNLHWLYLPEKKYPFFRIVFNSNLSQAKPDYCSLTLEISNGQYHDEIENLNLFDGEIISKFEKKVPYFYPIPTLDRDKNLKIINKYLLENQIFPIGRFGTWKYEEGNMDDAFEQGAKAIKD